MRLIHDDLARAERALSLQRLARRQQALRDIAAVRAAGRVERAIRRAERTFALAERALVRAEQTTLPGYAVHACSDSK